MPSTSKRRYHSPLRAAQAEATRRRIVGAALERFAANGVAGTSINDVARAAGVAPETVYGSFGSKAGLLGEIASTVVRERFPAEAFVRRHAELAGRPRAQIRHLVDVVGDFLAASPDLIRLYGAASREMAAAFEPFRRTMAGPGLVPFTDVPAGMLRADLDPERAYVVANAILTPGLYERMVNAGGMPLDEFKRRTAEILEAALFEPTARDPEPA
jgi:AcrR family transcriptional regulator